MKKRWDLIKESGLDYDGLPSDDQLAVDNLISIVAAAEREECAKVCDERERANLYGVKECAAAIRARGDK